MDFLKYISTPKNTTQADPKTTTLTLTAGRLVGGFLYFPRGPSGYLHFIAKIGAHQILPYNTEDSYRINGNVIPLHLQLDFFQPPFIIDCITWNTSTAYDHVLTVCFFLDPQEKPPPRQGIVKSLYNATLGYKKGHNRPK